MTRPDLAVFLVGFADRIYRIIDIRNAQVDLPHKADWATKDFPAYCAQVGSLVLKGPWEGTVQEQAL